jgi:hypothetical protein
MVTINRLIWVVCSCCTMSAFCAVPDKAPEGHPTIQEKKDEQIAARDGSRSNMERRYERGQSRDDDDQVAERDRDSNMERRYEREQGEELRDNN